MRKLLSCVLCIGAAIGIMSCAKENPKSDSKIKEILLHQLKTTHTEKEWFAPLKPSLEGVTAEQAMWRDSSGNHSVGQLAHHLLFWNKRALAKFNGQEEKEFSGDNKETFDNFNQAEWQKIVSELDSVSVALEKSIQDSDDAKLVEFYPTLANLSTHNAYHTGQIVFALKQQKAWDPEKGTK